jgi:hypothetical protein
VINQPLARRLGTPAFFRRLRLLDRSRLSPEDTTLPALKRLSRELVQHDRGRVLVLSFHCASLQPGNTPLIRTAHDRDRLLDRIDGFLTFFFS